MVARAGVLALASLGLLVSCGRGARSQAEPGPPRVSIGANAICRPQKVVEFDDLDKVRAYMRQLECLIVVHENRPDLDPGDVRAMRKLYGEIIEKLAKRNKWDDDSAAWEKVYDFTSRMNRIRNDLARHFKIPVFSVNGHHEATALWAESARNHPAPTLLHFDSHSDTRGLSDPAYVLGLGKKILTGKDPLKDGDELSKYLNDPATPCSAGVLILGFKNFIWTKPSWYTMGDIVVRPFFYGMLVKPKPGIKPPSKHWELYYDKSADNPGRQPVPEDSSWLILPKPASEMGTFVHVRRLLVSVLTTSPWPDDPEVDAKLKKEILEAIPKGPFVLDIDLDYFGTVDMTDGLERTAPPSRYEGRNKYLKPEVVKAREEKWRTHRKHVDRNIAAVEAMLRFMRKNGRIPTVVTLADSTYQPFAIHWWAEEFWEYSPKRMLPYVQYKVRKMLQRVYRDDGIGAVP